MSNGTSKAGEIASESAYVVHDKAGRIVHAHTVTHYKGAPETPRKEVEAMVLATAKQFGHKTEGLTVAAVAMKDLDLSAPVRFDLKTRKLVRVEPKAKSAPRKAAKQKSKKKARR
jgi:hypothetical protein